MPEGWRELYKAKASMIFMKEDGGVYSTNVNDLLDLLKEMAEALEIISKAFPNEPIWACSDETGVTLRCDKVIHQPLKKFKEWK